MFVAALAIPWASAQAQTPCSDTTAAPPDFNYNGSACQLIPSGTFIGTPFPDAMCTPNCPSYGDTHNDVVSLYGQFGNSETAGLALAHSKLGQTLGGQIVPRCPDGTTTQNNQLCYNNQPPAIVFLFIGFSNCDIEICGGNSDVWVGDNNALNGQPCATQCPNIHSAFDFHVHIPWNQVTNDPVTQMSFLYQVYPPTGQVLVGPHVAVFDGALGAQTLDRWDPTSVGYYAGSTNFCNVPGGQEHDPACNYDRVRHDLAANGFSEAQVQAIFLKSANGHPKCDLKGIYQPSACAGIVPDAFQAEIYMGDILRFLSGHTGTARYTNLKQVFLTSRIYGGYANGQPNDSGSMYAQCLNPEPFAYEEGFAIQRLIVAQITSTPDSNGYSGAVDTSVAPWFDWGPYLWANGPNQSSTGLFWCNFQLSGICTGKGDVRYGDPANQTVYWGDFTHPTANAEVKVTGALVNFLSSPWLTPWILK